MKKNQLTLSSLIVLAVAINGCATQPSDGGTKTADTTAAGQEQAPSEPLSLDPDVVTGTLDNGLTYFILHHEKPDNRALMWLAVDAGSVLEQDDQRGLAHFVEHMAFNGTERFEKNSMIDFFERSGMQFGADVNAYTSFDETVYMLQVPTDDAELMKTGFDVIEDWAGAVSFDPEEVDKERGVVIEEWRLGRGAGQRVFDKQWPIFLAGSKYAERKPIGKKEILENAPVERLQSFYEDWYRPDNMAVIIVGDVDPAAIEGEIEARFGDLENPKDAPEREEVPVPLLDETRIDIQTDPEMSMTQVSVSIKGPRSGFANEADYRESLVDGMFHAMLRARLDELGEKPDAPFMFSFSFTSEMGRAVDVFRLFAAAKPGQSQAAVELLLVELERVRKHGFTESEFERIKADFMRGRERAVTEADTVDGSRYARGLVSHFLEDQTMISPEASLALAQQYLPTLTLDEINELAETWTERKDRVVSIAGATRDKTPEDADILALLDDVGSREIEAWADEGANVELMASAPEPGSITKRERIDELDLSIWTLSNGARVVIKPTTFKNDEIMFEAFSPGGTSLVNDEVYKSANFASSIVGQAGVGDHDAVALSKALKGKVVSVRPFIGELEEGLRGNASPKDLETLMQLTHLHFTAPRKDPEAFEAWKGQMLGFAQNRDLNPQGVLFDEFFKAVSNDHVRRQPLSVEQVEAVDLDTAYSFYQERFADAGDFTFVFVGNVDEAQLEQLATTYLASLPSKDRKESWKNVGVKEPKGRKEVRIEQGQDPKAFVLLAFHGKAKWTPDNEDDMDMLSDALSIRLREILREDMGGVYGVFTNGNIDRRPEQEYQFLVGFGCSPDNAEKLTKAVFDLIADVKKKGVEDDVVEKLIEQRRRGLETDLEENRFWMRQLTTHYRYDTDPRKILELDKQAERVSSDRIRKTAKLYLGKQYVDALLMPAAEAEAKPEG